MLKFIHAADIHLDSLLRGLERYEGLAVEEFRAATRGALDNLVRTARDEEVDFVLIAGDLYDGDWPDFNTGLFFNKRMEELREANIRVYIVAGNHDALSNMTRSLHLPDNVKMFSSEGPETASLDNLGVAIHGQSFTRRDMTKNLALGYPMGKKGWFNIGLLHTCATGAEGHESYAPCSLDDLKSRGYDYWALGHVHKRGVLCEDPWIVFPGNLQGRHIREEGAKGCTLVTVEDSRIVNVEHRELDVLRWMRLEIEAQEKDGEFDLLERIEEGLSRLANEADGRTIAVRVEISGRCRAHEKIMGNEERWIAEIRARANALGGDGVWVEKVRLKTSRVVSLDELQKSDTALGELFQFIEEIRLGNEDIADCTKGIEDILKKLPPEVRTDPDLVWFADEKELREKMATVRDILASRLLRGEVDR